MLSAVVNLAFNFNNALFFKNRLLFLFIQLLKLWMLVVWFLYYIYTLSYEISPDSLYYKTAVI